MPKEIELSKIRIDGGTQTRVKLNEEHVADLAEKYQEGKNIAPVKVVWDGSDYWLYDGFHRYHARARAGLGTIPAEVTNGTQRDAILKACGENSDHGLKRSNEDKRKTVKLLMEDKEWGKKSDRQIADICRVSHTFVQKIREESIGNIANAPQNPSVLSSERETRSTRDGREYPVRQKPKPPAEPSQQEQVSSFFDGKNGASGTQSPSGQVASIDFIKHIKSAGVIIRFLDEAKKSKPNAKLYKQSLEACRELINALEAWAK